MFPNIKIINFCGSVDEPCSHPQFHQIVEHFADWNAHINIATNGSLRTTKWWTKLASVLPDSHRVVWGIDGSDELSEVYRRGSNFKKVEQNYRAFIAAGGKANWQFISFEHNQHQLETAKQMAKDEGFKEFKTIISHRKDSGGVVHKKVEVEENPSISCKYANQKRIFVNHMGNVIPCCHLNAKMLEFPVSGVHKDKFEDLLTQHDYQHDINLKNTSLAAAINGKVWTGIRDSWTSDVRIPRCEQVCKQNKRDIFIKELL